MIREVNIPPFYRVIHIPKRTDGIRFVYWCCDGNCPETFTDPVTEDEIVEHYRKTGHTRLHSAIRDDRRK